MVGGHDVDGPSLQRAEARMRIEALKSDGVQRKIFSHSQEAWQTVTRTGNSAGQRACIRRAGIAVFDPPRRLYDYTINA